MTNPIPYIRNKFCLWLTGLSLDEVQSMKDRCDELTQDNDWVSKSDFDPDDYDFSPLNDYDFSEFLSIDNVDEQIECFLTNNDYITAEYVKEQNEEAFEVHEEVINDIRNRLTALESKGKKKKKKENPPK